jgi:hypothetical protein
MGSVIGSGAARGAEKGTGLAVQFICMINIRLIFEKTL